MGQNLPGKAQQNKKFLAAKMIYFDADTAVNDAFNEYVRKKAHYIWKKEGMPQGQDKEILIKAEEEGKKMFKPKRKQQEDTAAISAPELDTGFNPQEMTKRINKLESDYAGLLDTVKKIDAGRNASKLKNSGTQPVQSEGEIQPADYVRKLELERDTLREELIVLTDKYSHACLEFEKKKEALNKEITGLISEKQSLSAKAAFIDEERSELLEKISLLEKENNDILSRKKEKLCSPEQNESQKNLIDKIKEMEQERLHLFKTVRDMEEEKRIIPYLDQKCLVYEEELKRSEAEKNSMEILIKRFEKERKEMAEKITLLEEKRNFRFELEQEKGMLQKKILELEEERNKLLHSLSGLEDTLVSGQDKRPGIDGVKAEFEKIAAENTALREKLKDASSISLEYSNQQKVVSDLEQELNNKLQQLSQMREREKELLLQISDVTQRQKAPYILDRKKLEELKDFTLEAIQARRWKNPEFVNGAYDAIGLFYRTILSDEPVKKQSAEDVPE